MNGTEGDGPPPQFVLSKPNRLVALLLAAAVLSVIVPGLSLVSIFAVAYVTNVLPQGAQCPADSCGGGGNAILILLTLGWACVTLIAGLVVAALAIRRRSRSAKRWQRL